MIPFTDSCQCTIQDVCVFECMCKLSVDGSLAASGITVFAPTYRERQVRRAAEK